MTTVEMRVRVPHCGPAGGGRPWLVLIAVLALGTGGVSNDRQVYSIFQYFLSSNQSCIADQIRSDIWVSLKKKAPGQVHA